MSGALGRRVSGLARAELRQDLLGTKGYIEELSLIARAAEATL